MDKRGISSVIAIVLIILITVAAVTIVWVVVIPLVRDNLEDTEIVEMSIDTSGGYTVWDEDLGRASVQIKRESDDVDVEKVQIIFGFEAGDSKSFIKDAPGKNQVVTYNFELDEKPIKVEIAPIIEGEVKDVVSSALEIPDGSLDSSEPYDMIDNGEQKTCDASGCEGECVDDGDCEDGEECVEGICVDFISVRECGTLDLEGRTYVLAGDIVDNDLTDDCINIVASDITLDCGDNSITSDDAYSGVYSNQLNTVIKNCEIYMGENDVWGGLGIGIELGIGADGSKIINNVLSVQDYGLVFRSVKNVLVEENTVELHEKVGVSVSLSDGITFNDNTIQSNGGNGVSVSKSDGITFNDNTIQSNGGNGVSVSKSDGIIFNSNTICDNSNGDFNCILPTNILFEFNTCDSHNCVNENCKPCGAVCVNSCS